MRTEEEIRRLMDHIRADDRLGDPATVFENAPLALVQMELEARVDALRWVLGGAGHGGGSAGRPKEGGEQ